jgi:hypothetical protein
MSLGFSKPQSYLNTFNSFRADFEDFNLFSNSFYENVNLDLLSPLNNLSTLNQSHASEDTHSVRISNPLTLRVTARNSIVNFNALQKVFRARFEDGRANANLEQFSQLNSIQPFLNTERVDYEAMLGKTKNSYFAINFYNNNSLNIFNTTFSSLSSLNFQFYDFPFLLSAKSDMSRYM